MERRNRPTASRLAPGSEPRWRTGGSVGAGGSIARRGSDEVAARAARAQDTAGPCGQRRFAVFAAFRRRGAAFFVARAARFAPFGGFFTATTVRRPRPA